MHECRAACSLFCRRPEQAAKGAPAVPAHMVSTDLMVSASCLSFRCLEKAAAEHEDEFSKGCLREVTRYQVRGLAVELNLLVYAACGK